MSTRTTLAERRDTATAALAAGVVPTRRTEDWKYTDLSRVLAKETLLQPGVADWTIESVPDGVLMADLSAADLPDWVEHHLGAANGASILAQASLALVRNGFALRVPAGMDAGTIRVRISGTGHVRALILVEEGAKLRLHETAATTDGFRNVGLELLACPNAEIVHLRMGEAAGGTLYESVEVYLKAAARYDAHFANFGARLSRLDLHAILAEADAVATLSGVAVLGGTDHADITTHIEHAAAGQSTQLFKYAVGGTAHAAYQGRITVREGADGTDSRQAAKGILLSERAEADLKPELLIFADDVKCAHGAAVGDLDEDALYYLASRGLGEREARDLLIRAFLGEAANMLADEGWREEIWQQVEAALPKAMETQS